MKRPILTIAFLLSAMFIKGQHRFTLEECRTMALEHSHGMKIAALQQEKAGAERKAVRALYLPSLSANATGIYLRDNIEMEMYLPTVVPDPETGRLVPNFMTHPVTGGILTGPDGNPLFNLYAWLPLEVSLQGAYMAGLSLEQPLYTGGRITAGNAMARIGMDMAAENMRLQRAETLFETDQAYWMYVSVQEKLALAEAYERLLQELEEQVRHAHETGYVHRNEWLRVKVRHNEARLQLQQALNGRELARMDLCRMIGLPFDTPLETTDSILNQAEPVLPLKTAAPVAGRSEYRLLEKQVDLAREQVRLARAEFLPTAGIRLGYNYVGGIELGPTAYDEGNASVIASVSLPLFHWGEGRRKQQSARKDLDIRQAELDRQAGLMVLEMEQAGHKLAEALKRVRLAEETMELAEENLRVHRDRFELSMGVLTELLEAQVQWQSARSTIIEARGELRLQETAYRKAMGTLK